jgi:purine-cytosine permease-like protein
MVNGKSFISLYKGSLKMEIVTRKWSMGEAFSFCGTNAVVTTSYLPTFQHYMDLILLYFDTWLPIFPLIGINEFYFIKFQHSKNEFQKF